MSDAWRMVPADGGWNLLRTRREFWLAPWFSAYAFRHTRRFTSLFLLSVILDTLLL
jgi:hypothetical protein